MEIVGFTVISLGVVIGLINWPVYIRREINKNGPSAVPVVAPVLVLLGSMLIESSIFKSYLWLILVIDFTALPMILYIKFRVMRDKLRAAKST